ncbi:MAG: response regulator [Selenomonadaceae bacterium]|nr:response regulator [Selenomonadaceae bacterium]
MLDFKSSFYEKIFDSLDNNAVLMRITKDRKFFPVWCSREFAEMVEGTAEEFIEREKNEPRKNIHPDDREKVDYLFQNKILPKGKNSLTIRQRTLKGNWIWINVHYAFVEDDGVEYAYCNCFDVTKIKRNEQRTRILYEGVRAELENFSANTLVALRLNLTQDVVEDCRGRELYDIDLRGMKISERFEQRASYFPLERDRKKFHEEFNAKQLLKNFAEGKNFQSAIFFSRRPNGRECFVNYSVTLRRDPETEDIIAFATEQDYNTEIVSNTVSRKALADQFDMITYIVDGKYGVVIGDESKILRGSIFPHKRKGFYEDYLNEQVRPALTGTPEEREKFYKALTLEKVEQALEIHEPYEVNIHCFIEGEIYHKRFFFYLVDKEAKFYILLKSDITKIQRAQFAKNEQLKNALEIANQANVAKTAFLSAMSHEIRTPMNAIIGLDSIALKEPGISGKLREHLEKIGSSARHLLGIINDILDMSRIESGRMILKHEEFSFSGILEQINTMVGGQCKEKGLQYDCTIRSGVDDYYIGDDMKLKQVLINILGNAVKFTDKGGKVSFLVEQIAHFEDKSTLRFVIKDTGIGIEKEYLPKIFDPFSQEDSRTSTSYGGTGLGLAITKNIVETMNGKIDVKSEKGVGSEFTVNVTLRNSPKTAETVKPKKINVQDLNVLVVDYDVVASEHAKLVLEEVGITAETALSGAEAIEKVTLKKARHEFYNILLIDLRMPKINGIEITRQIREIIGNESAIIILTAYNWDDIVEEAMAAGVDRFMSKPLFATTIVSEFHQALEQKNRNEPEKELAELEGRKILMAEDVPVNAEIMMMVLSMRGMEVEHAPNGQEAVNAFAKSPEGYFDAVLMDIRMPIMDGLTATESIRALNRSDAKKVPIIAMTANAFDEDVQRSLQAGMNAHLSKPVEPEHLFQTLAELIEP